MGGLKKLEKMMFGEGGKEYRNWEDGSKRIAVGSGGGRLEILERDVIGIGKGCKWELSKGFLNLMRYIKSDFYRYEMYVLVVLGFDQVGKKILGLIIRKEWKRE